jgi:hypothetical protein
VGQRHVTLAISGTAAVIGTINRAERVADRQSMIVPAT